MSTETKNIITDGSDIQGMYKLITWFELVYPLGRPEDITITRHHAIQFTSSEDKDTVTFSIDNHFSMHNDAIQLELSSTLKIPHEYSDDDDKPKLICGFRNISEVINKLKSLRDDNHSEFNKIINKLTNKNKEKSDTCRIEL